MKRIIFIAAAALALISAGGCTKYQKVPGDPMDAKIYTLDNGLKVYMSVNPDEPRIQTYIAVRAGGKNDPSDNTGLAHYLEHMMFKGTEIFGTSDYAAEKPMLEAIDSLFEVYRTKTDTAERLAVYHLIDSISFEASKLAIPNEYDKLMSIIGAEGTNAFTSDDVTCYVENIPSNQIENWAKIEADRFKNCVFRGFHTELEAVYEEKNMGLTSGTEKAIDALDSMLFVNHPYGTQTVIGTQDHLKNPSLVAIRKQKDTYYVPNNVAICLSGDFDPVEMIRIIKKYFGDWKPNPNLPKFEYAAEEPITSPKVKDVYGNDSEFVLIGWRTPGENSQESETGEIAASVLYNGMAGLIDLNVNNAQKLLFGAAMNNDLSDYGEFLLQGVPKYGQSLEDVRDILLAEVAKLRSGDFDESLITSTVNNLKLSRMRQLESNSARAMMFVNSFINGTSWESEVGKMERMERITKEDVVAWAQKYLGENSYVLVNKYTGEDKNIKKIAAPQITPIVTNRDKQSAFLVSVQNSTVKPIEPVFVDYSKDLSRFETQGLDVLYKHNDKNDIAQLSFRFNTGSAIDPALSFSSAYLEYLGTPSKDRETISSELYGLACSYSVNVGAYNTAITVSGLSENIAATLDIVEDLLLNAEGNDFILAALKDDEFKSRADSKMNQRACNSALQRYLYYGPDYVRKTVLPNGRVAALTSDELLAKLKDLLSCEHQVLYYGPASEAELKNTLAGHHKISGELKPLEKQYAHAVPTPASKVILAPYPSRQFNYVQYSNRGETFELADAPVIRLFNEYFGGGMNTIVFQEMRESRALAYSAGAYLTSPAYKDDNYYFRASIGSQNDKLQTAVEAFDEIINNMPESEKSLEISKTSIESSIRTARVTGLSVIYSFINAQDLGLSEPIDKLIFEKIGSLTMDDLVAAQEKWIKDRTYVYAILGDPTDMDTDYLKTLGPLQMVSLEEIFGY